MSDPSTAKTRTSPVRTVRWAAVIRDVVVIYATCFVTTMVCGLVSYRLPQSLQNSVTASLIPIIPGVAGFAFSGYKAAGFGRRSHLAFVALGIWLTGFYGMILDSSLCSDWTNEIGFGRAGRGFVGMLVVALIAICGGALSYVFKKEPQSAA